jgi:hypothetical protein
MFGWIAVFDYKKYIGYVDYGLHANWQILMVKTCVLF